MEIIVSLFFNFNPKIKINPTLVFFSFFSKKVYIDVGTGPTNPVTLSFVTSGTGFDRSWRVRIAQIPCSSIYRAEEGCMQYYTGVSGQIKSFNYDPNVGLQLSNQDYSICIRMERNFCGIQYMTCDDGGNILLIFFYRSY